MCSNITSLEEVDTHLCEKYLDVNAYLNYFSLDNYNDFCLAYGFTARDFDKAILGITSQI